MFDAYDRWISQKNWDHLKFLRYLLLIVVLILLFFILWILYLAVNDIIDPEFLEVTLRDLGFGFLYGAIFGLLEGFFLLLPKYRNEIWDLHVIVPYFLFYHLIISVLLLLGTFIVSLEPIMETGIVLGQIIGGMVTVLAYAGEVNKEHISDSEFPLID